MQTKFNNLIMHDNVFAYIAVATGILMSVPMVMTSLNPSAHINGGTGGGWDWSAGDYLVMAVLIFSTASLFVLSARRFRKHRLALGLTFLLALIVLWVHLAVGIVDSWPFAGS
jgi:hypothetical protein